MTDILGDIEREELKKLKFVPTKSKKPIIRTKTKGRRERQREPLEEEIIEDVYELPEEERGPKKTFEKRGTIIKVPEYTLVNLEKEKKDREKQKRKKRPVYYSFNFTDEYDEPRDEEDDDAEKENTYEDTDEEPQEGVVIEEETGEKESLVQQTAIVLAQPRTKKMIKQRDITTKYVPYPPRFDKFLKVLGITHGMPQGKRAIQVETTGLVRVVEHEMREIGEREFFVGRTGELIPIKRATAINYVAPKDIIIPPTEEFLKSEGMTLFKTKQEFLKLKERITTIKKQLDIEQDDELERELERLKEEKYKLYQREERRETKERKIKRKKLGKLRAKLNESLIRREREVKRLEYKILERRRLLKGTLGIVSDKEVESLKKKIEELQKRTKSERELEAKIREIRRDLVSYEKIPGTKESEETIEEPRFVSYTIKILVGKGKILARDKDEGTIRVKFEDQEDTIRENEPDLEITDEKILKYRRIRVKGRIIGSDDTLFSIKRLSNKSIDKVRKDDPKLEYLAIEDIEDGDYYPVNYYREDLPVGTWINYSSYDTIYTGVIRYINGNDMVSENDEYYQLDSKNLVLASKAEIGGTFFIKERVNYQGVVYDFNHRGIFVWNLKSREELFILYPKFREGKPESFPTIEEISDQGYRPRKTERKLTIIDVLNQEVPEELRELVKKMYFEIFKRGFAEKETKTEETLSRFSELSFIRVPRPIRWTEFFTRSYLRWYFKNFRESDVKGKIDTERIQREVEERYRDSSNVKLMLEYLNHLMGDNLFKIEGTRSFRTAPDRFVYSDVDLVSKLRSTKTPDPVFGIFSIYLLNDLGSGLLKRERELRGRELGKEIYRIFIRYLERLIQIKQSEVSARITDRTNKLFEEEAKTSSLTVEFASKYRSKLRGEYLEYLQSYLLIIDTYIRTRNLDEKRQEVEYFLSIKDSRERLDTIINTKFDEISGMVERLNNLKLERDEGNYSISSYESQRKDIRVQSTSGVKSTERENEDIRLKKLRENFDKFERNVYETNKISTKTYLDEILYPYIFLGTPIAQYCKFFRAKFFSGKISCDILNRCRIAEFFPELAMNLKITTEDWIVLSRLFFNTRNVAVHNTLNIFYSMYEPAMKLNMKTYSNTEIRFIKNLLVDPRKICKRDTRTGLVKINDEIQEISDADLVICADEDSKFSCHSSEALVQQFKREDFTNHVTGERYSNEFIDRMLRREGIKQEIRPVSYNIAKRVGLGAPPQVREFEGRKVRGNLFDVIYTVQFGEVEGQEIVFEDPSLQNDINIYGIDLERDTVDKIPFVGKNDHVLVWNSRKEEENEIKERWLQQRPFIKSITFVRGDYEEYDVIMNAIVTLLKENPQAK